MNALCLSLHATATALLLMCSLGAAHADTVKARCDIYPKGSDTASKVVACNFSQRQGGLSTAPMACVTN